MKVTGPHTGAPAPEPEATRGKSPAGEIKSGSAESVGSVERKPGGSSSVEKTFAETLAAARPAPASTSAHVNGPDALTSDIAADLKAGKVDAKGALERVVERVLDRQLGADAPAELRA